MSKAIVLLSGGIESTLLMYIAKLDHELCPLTIDYGQLARQELIAAQRIAEWYGVTTTLATVSPIIFGSDTSLIHGNLDTRPFEEVDSVSEPKVSSDVPFRNGVFISMAAAHAIALGANSIYFGATFGGERYHRDCSPWFIRSMRTAIEHASSLSHTVNLVAPFVDGYRTKADTIRQSYSLWKEDKLPLHLTWSCYSTHCVRPCGECLSCTSRAHTFRELGLEDPCTVSKE